MVNNELSVAFARAFAYDTCTSAKEVTTKEKYKVAWCRFVSLATTTMVVGDCSTNPSKGKSNMRCRNFLFVMYRTSGQFSNILPFLYFFSSSLH